MKTKNKSILLLTIIIASQMLSSCSQVKLARIEKRHYMKGYHVNIAKKPLDKNNYLINNAATDGVINNQLAYGKQNDRQENTDRKQIEPVKKSANVKYADVNASYKTDKKKVPWKNKNLKIEKQPVKETAKKIRSSIKEVLVSGKSLKSVSDTNNDVPFLALLIISIVTLGAAIVIYMIFKPAN